MSRKEVFFMDRQFKYRSVFSPYFESFMKMKDAMGYGLNKFGYTFLELDRFFLETGATDTYITSRQIAAWRATRSNDGARTLYEKYSVLSQFCRYMCHLGHECYVPRMPKRKEIDFMPYVFTHEQMGSIFRECDGLAISNCSNMSTALVAIPALIRLLYSTGARIGEALAIRNMDIDYAHDRIIITETKNKMQRMVPINPSLKEVMKQYESYRDRMPVEGLADRERSFFVTANGRPFARGTAYSWFKKVLKQCGIPHIGKQQGPRVHDIRHTCAVHSLEKMVKSGADIYCALPILSTFLGHKTIAGTEKYVRMTREIHPDIIDKENVLTSFVFPIKTETDIDYGNDY
ncbi:MULTISPECIES: tyrosine-type recombinase/integrase [Flagellimonas]|uniref:Tyrosine-type recombinase/integrase n=3 Tax=Flagellimonas TaxID=444459 RepID=A0A6G7IZQ9_9FLAO|nr:MULTISPECIES: tyrosine-type recombinase/integrase [Allomuricauda]QII43804.1 tyrosine-type recombinase/integrase [Allomuricauda oceani]QII45363.1 tyrosine-type recombinase/integrase [Allomuricauda oceani]RIV42817.1 nicotinate-nucleotide pyrophosphorylase [Allomuricauda maritima]TXJ92011.1 tyrosine-type recombinase/integrase [Allomuricauda maritima]